MRRLWVLAAKEVRVTVRDVGALLLRLATPLALTLAMAAAFGGGGDTLEAIPVVLLNHDEGAMGQVIVDAFQSVEMAEIISASTVADNDTARELVERDRVAAVVIVPADFTEVMAPMLASLDDAGMDMSSLENIESFDYGALSPEQQQQLGAVAQATSDGAIEPATLQIIASPRYDISAKVVRIVTQQIIESIAINMEGMSIVFERLAFADGADTPSMDSDAIGAMMKRVASDMQGDAVEALDLVITTSGKRPFNWLDYSASSMAILFLMFGVTHGASTLLRERQQGTLPRLLMMPVGSVTVLAGKMAGVAVTGYLQVLVLWGATQLIGATGQASALSTMISLVAAAASGNYFPRENLPQWLQRVSLIVPNAWGIEIFSTFQRGGSLVDALPFMGAALALSIIYYAIAVIGFRRQFI